MVRTRFFASVLLAGTPWFSANATDSYLLGEVSKLPLEIRMVKHCGDWRHGNQEGYYRLVVGDVHSGAGSEIYVQWVTHPSQEKPSEVLKTLSFPELNDDHAQYYFKSVVCEKKGRTQLIRAKGLYEHDEKEKEHQILIKLIDIGRYQIVKGSAR